jgi:glutamyl-tRNA synthetase
MVLGEGRKEKLSKRHGAVSVQEFADAGYLPQAMRNYLVRLGWSLDDRREMMSMPEILEAFCLDRIRSSAAAWDSKKLTWLNGRYIAEMSVTQRLEKLDPLLRKHGWLVGDPTPEEHKRLERIVEAVGDRLKTLGDFVDQAGFFFAEDVMYEDKAVRKRFGKPEALQILEAAYSLFARTDPFDAEHLENIVRNLAGGLGVSAGSIIHPVRVSVTGKMTGPGLFEVLEILGKQKVCLRLAYGIYIAGEMARERAPEEAEAAKENP